MLALTAFWPVLELRHASGNNPAVGPTLPSVAGRGGWVAATEPFTDWRPDLSGADAELAQTFLKDRAPVGLFIAFYNNPSPDAKAITSTNQLVWTNNRKWQRVAVEATATTNIEGQPFDARTTVVARHEERLAVWQWYWVDGHVTTSQYVAKMYEALAVLQGHGDPAAWVVVFTPTEHDEAQVRRTLQSFTTVMREPIDAALREAARTQ